MFSLGTRAVGFCPCAWSVCSLLLPSLQPSVRWPLLTSSWLFGFSQLLWWLRSLPWCVGPVCLPSCLQACPPGHCCPGEAQSHFANSQALLSVGLLFGHVLTLSVPREGCLPSSGRGRGGGGRGVPPGSATWLCPLGVRASGHQLLRPEPQSSESVPLSTVFNRRPLPRILTHLIAFTLCTAENELRSRSSPLWLSGLQT